MASKYEEVSTSHEWLGGVEVSFGAGVKAVRDSHADLISSRALPEPGWP